jgi:C1A family cysteine protease
MMISRVALIGAFLFCSNVKADTNAVFVRHNDGSVEQYKLLPVHHDPTYAKNLKGRFQFQAQADLPAKYSIAKELLPPVRNQGSRGTCAYFATVGLMETRLLAQSPTNAGVKLSEQCLVNVRNWMADTDSYTGDDKPVDYRPDPDGDWPQLIAKTVEYFGVPAEGQYPTADCRYSTGSTKGVSLSNYSETMLTGGSIAYGKGHKFEVDEKPTIARVKELISQNIPVEVGVLVYNEYFDTSNWAYKPSRDKQSTLAGGHAIQLVGYRSSSNGGTIFTFKNSWGNWGSGGYGTVDNKLLEHSWGYDPGYDFALSFHE